MITTVQQLNGRTITLTVVNTGTRECEISVNDDSTPTDCPVYTERFKVRIEKVLDVTVLKDKVIDALYITCVNSYDELTVIEVLHDIESTIIDVYEIDHALLEPITPGVYRYKDGFYYTDKDGNKRFLDTCTEIRYNVVKE